MKIITLLIGLFLTACVSVDAKEPQVCEDNYFIILGQKANQSVSLETGFMFDVKNIRDYVQRIIFVNGTISRSNDDTFDFVNEAVIIVKSPSNKNLEDLVLWDGQHVSGNTLNIYTSDVNLIDYIDTNNKINVHLLLLTNNPPILPWAINSSLCISGEYNKDYLLFDKARKLL